MPTRLTDINSSSADTPLQLEQEAQVKLLHRLRRLEGQVRGLQGMIEEGRSCREVLTLLAGVRSALNASGEMILEHYVETCHFDSSEGRANLGELLDVVRLARG
jgi:DNA-binding FrmR family transcriptional regulator